MFINQNTVSVTLDDKQLEWLEDAVQRVRSKTSRSVSKSDVLIMLFADGFDIFESKFPKEKLQLRVIK